MNNKKITFLLLSDSNGRVKKWEIPYLFIFPAIAFFLATVVSLYVVLSDYFAVRTQAPRIAAIIDQNERHNEQQAYLSARLDKVTEKLEGLKEQEQKLRALANQKWEDDESRVMGMGGGSEPDTASNKVGEEPSVSLVSNSREKGAGLGATGLDSGLGIPKTEYHPENTEGDVYPLLPFRPFELPSPGWVFAGFGPRTAPITGELKFYKGIEIATKMNTPVRAPADGLVLHVGEDHRYGKTITIEHGYGIVTRYGHLEEIMVDEGEHVPKGKAIARVGARRAAIGPTLHYKVMLGGIPINPLRFPLG